MSTAISVSIAVVLAVLSVVVFFWFKLLPGLAVGFRQFLIKTIIAVAAMLVVLAMKQGGTPDWYWPFIQQSQVFYVMTAWPETSSGDHNATVVFQKMAGGHLKPKQMMDVRLEGDLPKPGQLVMFGKGSKLVIVGTVAESVTQPVAPVEPVVAPASDAVVDPISTPAVKQEKFAPIIPSRKTTAKK